MLRAFNKYFSNTDFTNYRCLHSIFSISILMLEICNGLQIQKSLINSINITNGTSKNYSLRINGYISANQTGTHAFGLYSDNSLICI